MTEAPGTGTVYDQRDDNTNWLQSIPMLGVHVWAVIAVFQTGFHLKLALACLASYYVRMVGVTLGYHRYFAHRTFKTSRPMQFLIAWLAESSLQKGVLWWAGHHRHHHKYSDQPQDVHSPSLRGFWYSHIGWILSNKYEDTDHDRVKDLNQFPELVFLNKFFLLPPLATGAVIWAVFGYDVFVWAGIIATALLWHGTFTINSLSHVYGTRPYATTDTSRNNFLLALITCGEGWHNNHHHYQSTANQGWHWWQLDLSYYIIKILQALGLVWDVREAPEHVIAGEAKLIDKLKPVIEPVLQKAAHVAQEAATVAHAAAEQAKSAADAALPDPSPAKAT